MPFYEREERLLEALSEKESMSVSELAETLFISIPTARRDLKKLEAKGLIVRTFGGASIKKRPADAQVPFILREHEGGEAKVRIAAKAKSFVFDGATIMLDGSTSAYALIPYLSEFNDIIVIASSAKAAVVLGNMGIKTICTGGHMKENSYAFVGYEAERTVADYNADVVFFSCRGLSEDGVLTDRSIEENDLRRVMLSHAKKKVLLLDSGKIGKSYLNRLCSLSEIDELVTECDIPEHFAKMLKK